MDKKLQILFQTEMSRKEFLGLIGAGLMAIIGINALLKNLGLKTSLDHQATQHTPSYGGNFYGGPKSR